MQGISLPSSPTSFCFSGLTVQTFFATGMVAVQALLKDRNAVCGAEHDNVAKVYENLSHVD